MSIVKLTGGASIPIMLLLLGIQLAHTDPTGTFVRAIPAISFRLLTTPLAAAALTLILGFQNPAVTTVFVLESAMLASVSTLVLTIEYTDSLPESSLPNQFVSKIIFITTLLEAVTVSILVAILRVLPFCRYYRPLSSVPR